MGQVITTQFGDLENDSESHYVVLEQGNAGYEVWDITITKLDEDGEPIGTVTLVPHEGDWDEYMSTQFDQDGKPYWAVKVDQGNDYRVEFNITTPNVNTDTKTSLGAGTITVDNTHDGSNNNEPNYLNNWKEDIKDVAIHTGVVETDHVDLTGTGLEDGYCHLALGELISKEGQNENNAEEVVKILIKTETLKGTLYEFDGTNYVEVAKTPRIDADNNEIADKFDYVLDPNKDYAIKGENDFSGTLGFDFNVIIKDTESGAEKTLENQKGSVEITPVADAPTNLAVTVTDDGEGALQLALSATLADTSEKLFFLVEKVEGLHGSYSTFTDSETGISYFQVPAGTGGKATGSFTVDDTFEGLHAVYAMSQESNGDYALSSPFAGDGYEKVVGDPSGGNYNYSGSDVDGPVHFIGDAGDETVTGSQYNDIISLGDGDDIIIASGGSDVLKGGVGTDTLDYSSIVGGVGITANLADGRITLGDPNNGGWSDSVSDFEIFKGTDNGDTIYAGGGVTTIFGGAGNDTIYGSDANETIYAGSGDDIIYGGKGNDTMYAGEGVDTFGWKLGDLGDFKDIIHGFEVGEDKDKLMFDPSLDDLIRGAVEALGDNPEAGQTGPLFADDKGNTFNIECGADSCTLTLGTDSGSQTIELNGTDFSDYASNNDLAQLIETIIKIDSGN